jgi:hypothetical protein
MGNAKRTSSQSKKESRDMLMIAGGILIAFAIMAVFRHIGAIITVLFVLWLIGHFCGS